MEPKKAPDLQPVFVIWEDAFSIDEWTDISDLESQCCAMIHSCGFLLEETMDHVVLALNYDTANESASCVMYIPTNMVKAIVPLDK